jgi:hypothetical protein
MGAPYLAHRYNEDMNNVDTHDFKALQEHFSWERRSRSRKWEFIAFKGIFDRMQVNSYEVLVHRNQGVDASSHEQFFSKMTV